MVIAVIASMLLFFFPVAKYVSDVRGTYFLFIWGMKYMGEVQIVTNFWISFPMLFIISLSIIMISVSIFFYKKRGLQLWLVNISFLLNIILISLIFFYYTGHFSTQTNATPSYQFWILMPIVSFICLVMASRAIRKDEALVRSSDRLR
jgi:hypothetical protein